MNRDGAKGREGCVQEKEREREREETQKGETNGEIERNASKLEIVERRG